MADYLFLAAPIAPTPDLIGRWALWMLILIILLLLMVIGMLSLMFQRRRQERRTQLDSRVGRDRDAPRIDAWEESGRRLRLGKDDSEGRLEKSEDADPSAATSHGETASTYSMGTELAAFSASVLARGRRLALVTGGAKRVGRAICIELAKSGCDVIFTYHSSSDEAKQLGEELRESGCAALAVELDLTDLPRLEEFGSELSRVLPRLDVLVHNASVYEAGGIEDLDVHQTLRHITVNAVAPLILTSGAAIPLTRSILAGGGAIVAMLDIHAMGRPRKGYVGYSMSKAALAELVYSAAREFAPHVRVNGVAPGVVAWPEQGEESQQGPQSAYLRRVPLGRAGTPQDAAEVVRWLALDATYVTGQIVRVDGGRWIT